MQERVPDVSFMELLTVLIEMCHVEKKSQRETKMSRSQTKIANLNCPTKIVKPKLSNQPPQISAFAKFVDGGWLNG